MTTAMNTAMSTTHSTIGVVLMVVGVAMVWASDPRHGRRRARAASSHRRLPAAPVCAAVTGGLITGMQWTVINQTGPGAWVAVLGRRRFWPGPR